MSKEEYALDTTKTNDVAVEDGQARESQAVAFLPVEDTVNNNKDEEEDEERTGWNTRFDFLLSTVGFAVDLANVWRFPYLCYKNGGGAFLLPYFIMMLLGALPMFYLELLIGQYQKSGIIGCWKMAPIFKGLGFCCCLVSFYVSWYYNVVISWALYYLLVAFTGSPWESCDNPWNTPDCYNMLTHNQSEPRPSNKTYSPATEYFERVVLDIHRSSGLDDLGQPSLKLVICTFVVLLMVYFSLWKGVKSMGKAVWVTATLPYVVLLILLIRGVMLEGAGDGIKYFITPSFDRIANQQVWIDAAVQIFFSVGAGFGVHVAYSSYNPKTNNCYRDCISACVINSFTSLFAGFVVFSYLGFMAKQSGVELKEVIAEGPGLVFIVYPQAISTIPGNQFWAICFFVMLVMLGLDSSFGGLESILTGLSDEYRSIMKRFKWSRELLTLALCCGTFCFSIMNVTYGGMYMVTLMDKYAAGSSILIVALMQAIAVAWVYGLDQLCADAKEMLGSPPGMFWRICWKYISPIFLMVIVTTSSVSHEHLEYETMQSVYTYPDWADNIGIMFVLSSVLLIPLTAIIMFITAKGNSLKLKIAYSITPISQHHTIAQGRIRRFDWRHWFSLGPAENSFPWNYIRRGLLKTPARKIFWEDEQLPLA